MRLSRSSFVFLLSSVTLVGCSSDASGGDDQSDSSQGGSGGSSLAQGGTGAHAGGGAGKGGASGHGGTSSKGGASGTTAHGGATAGPVGAGGTSSQGGGTAGPVGAGGSSAGGSGTAAGGSPSTGGSTSAGGSGPQPMGDIGLFVASSHTKIQPTTAAGTDTSIVLEGLKDSYEAAQIVIRPKSGAAGMIDLVAPVLDDGAGHTIAASNVVFFREGFTDFSGVAIPAQAQGGTLPAPASSPTADPNVPDALIPLVNPYTGAPAGAPFDVAAGQNQPVWVDVHIPKDAAPGIYHGTVLVNAAGQQATPVPITLTVWDLALPDMRTVPTWFQINVNNVIDYHQGTAACDNGNCYLDQNATSRAVVARYEDMAHEHRIETRPKMIPPADSGCDAPDFSAWDAAMQPYMDGTRWADGVPTTAFPTPFSPGVTWGMETCSQSQYTALAKTWADHLKQKGWFKQAYVASYDEPPPDVLPAIALNAGWLRDADPDWTAQILDTTAPTASGAPILDGTLGIYVACLKCYGDWDQNGAGYYGRAQWPAELAAGKQLWFYESNAQSSPYPGFATDTLDGAEPRIMAWGAWWEKATGFLYWDMAQWDKADPWGPNISFHKTGDGVLLYPGNHDGLAAPAGSPPDVAIDGPVGTYRLKMIRAGLQDWALFHLADTLGLGDMARAEVAKVYNQLGGCDYTGCAPDTGSWYWNSDPVAMADARRNIVMAIMAH